MPIAAAHTGADANAVGALEALCAQVRDTMKAQHASLWVADSAGATVRPFATTRTDLDASAVQRWARVPLDDFPLARVVVERRSVVVVGLGY